MNPYSAAAREAFSDQNTLLYAVKLAIIVGTILNLINQGDYLMSGSYDFINWPKLLMTYCVPFCVSMVTNISMRARIESGDWCRENTQFECKCGQASIAIETDGDIPACPACGTPLKVEPATTPECKGTP